MELKVKFELEFPIHASPQMLFQYISSASGLSEWFADNVNSRGIIFSFFWDGSEEKAELISSKSNSFVKFRWLDDSEDQDKCFFQIKIVVDEITKDVSLMVTDFAYEDEVEETKMLWDNQISDLKQVLGSS
ncbi:MAG: START-like domain-containing protein [Flavobacteriaceae bacterium]